MRVYVSFIFFFLNAFFFWKVFKQSDSFLLFFCEIAIYFVVICFSLRLFSFSKYLLRAWVGLLFVLSVFAVYFIDSMGLIIDKQVVYNIFETNTHEAFELVANPTFLSYAVFSLVVIVLFFKYVVLKLQRVGLKEYFAYFFGLIALFLALSSINKPYYKHFFKFDSDSVVPLNLINGYAHYLRIRSRMSSFKKISISDKFSFDSSKEPIFCVVVIGESARADRFSLGGYKKETNPLLKELDNIFFKKALSCDTSTLSSVPCMVLRDRVGEFSFPVKENSFVKVFSDFGFDTYWLSLQHEALVIKNFCKEAKSCEDFSAFKYDDKLLKRLKEIAKKQNKNTLVVLHTMGSHYDYNNRVPDSFKKFFPICKKSVDSCKRDELDNSYDNSILYTDYFLKTLADILKDKNSFFIYSSDHGESLGEVGFGVFKKFGHATPVAIAPKEQREVPFIFWGSDTFVKKHKIVTDTEFSHNYIFHSTLGCAGFSSKLIDKRFCICR